MATQREPSMEEILYATQTLDLDQPEYRYHTVRHVGGDEVIFVVDVLLRKISVNADAMRLFLEEENLLTPYPNQLMNEFTKFEYIATGNVQPVIPTNDLQDMIDYIMEEAICYESGPLFTKLNQQIIDTVLHGWFRLSG